MQYGYMDYRHRDSGRLDDSGSGKKISVSAISLQGTRKRQEDYLLYGRRNDRVIAVVCDGIGGMDNGDVASRTAAEILFSDLEQARPTEDMSSYFQSEMEKLDDAVFGLQNQDGSRMKAGTTVAAVLLHGNRLHWFSMGDSRLYLSRGWRLQCLTKAHNYAAVLEEAKRAGAVDEAWYREESRKGEWLTSYLGMGIAEQFDYGSLFFSAEPEEKLLLCTDGLYKTVCHEELTQILQSAKSVDVVSRRLREAVLQKNRPAQDNATWIVIGGEEG